MLYYRDLPLAAPTLPPLVAVAPGQSFYHAHDTYIMMKVGPNGGSSSPIGVKSNWGKVQLGLVQLGPNLGLVQMGVIQMGVVQMGVIQLGVFQVQVQLGLVQVGVVQMREDR